MWAVAIAVAVPLVLAAVSYPPYRRDMDAARRRLARSKIAVTRRGIIEYAVSGAGSPVLLLHGAGGGFDQGVCLGELCIGGGHELIAVSRYGFLRTPIPANATIAKEAALYAGVLDHLGVREQVLVVGFSAGGPSAIQFCADYPDRCSGLVLLSAVSGYRQSSDQSPFIVGIINTIQRSDFAYRMTTHFFQSTILGMMGIPRDTYAKFTPEQKQVASDLLAVMHPMSPRYAGTMNDGKMLKDAAIPMDRVMAPTLILHARDDALVSFAHAEKSHRGIAHSRLVAFPTGGHGLISRSTEIRNLIRAFLDEAP